MDGFNGPWVLALLLAIPLSVLGNFLTRQIEKYLDNRPQQKMQSQIKSLKHRVNEATKINVGYEGASHFLISRLAQATAILAITGAFAATVSGTVLVVDVFGGFLSRVTTGLGQMSVAFGGIIAFQLLNRALRTSKDLQAVNQLSEQLDALEAEHSSEK